MLNKPQSRHSYSVNSGFIIMLRMDRKVANNMKLKRNLLSCAPLEDLRAEVFAQTARQDVGSTNRLVLGGWHNTSGSQRQHVSQPTRNSSLT